MFGYESEDLEKSLANDPIEQQEETNQIIRMLTKALADELLAAYQYWVCKNLSRGKGKADCDPEFDAHAKEEMSHADMIVQRIKELGGRPLTNPKDWEANANPWTEVKETSVPEMLKITIDAEKTAIAYYKEVIAAVKDEDPTTYRMIKQILADEEEHLYDLQMLEEDVTK